MRNFGRCSRILANAATGFQVDPDRHGRYAETRLDVVSRWAVKSMAGVRRRWIIIGLALAACGAGGVGLFSAANSARSAAKRTADM
jgi:hypothetical protein